MVTIDDVGAGFGGLIIVFLLISVVLFVLHIALCVWAYRDATRKGRSPEFALLVLIALFFFPVLGLIVYLLIRNDAGNSRYGR
ncbi:PLDc N-terminal domain-containing protein [Cohnella sp. GCM10027633]|uniref:PLDc N-terminal domain-containing protein n=1 Tax=unclassified Cohnella TaxID=2636738 RepID=UPI00363741BD